MKRQTLEIRLFQPDGPTAEWVYEAVDMADGGKVLERGGPFKSAVDAAKDIEKFNSFWHDAVAQREITRLEKQVQELREKLDAVENASRLRGTLAK